MNHRAYLMGIQPSALIIHEELQSSWRLEQSWMSILDLLEAGSKKGEVFMVPVLCSFIPCTSIS